MLLHCPVFNSFRATAKAKLRFGIPFDMQTILGCYGDVKRIDDGFFHIGRDKDTLDVTGEFLLAINNYMHRL
jgi:hypothetical protein